MSAYQKLYYVSAHGGATNDLLYPLLTTTIYEFSGVAHVHTDDKTPCGCGAVKHEFHVDGCAASSSVGIIRALDSNAEAILAQVAPKLRLLTPLGQGELSPDEIAAVRAHCDAGGIHSDHHPAHGDHMHHIARKLHAHHSEGVTGAHSFLRPMFY
jgi:hypothetical protein